MSAKDFAHLQKGVGGRVWVEYLSDVAIIRMELGENRMNDLFVDGIMSALDDVEKKPDIKAVITTGSGKFYSNGLDLEWLATLASNIPDYLDKFFMKWQNLQRRLLTFPIVTVAAINGHAFAGGALFSVVHDYRVMSNEKGWWCLNEVFLQMRFQPWMVQLLRTRLSSPRVALDAIVYGRRYPAAEAKDSGIVELTSSPSQLISTSRTLVKQMVPESGIVRESLSNMKLDFYADILKMIADSKPANTAHRYTSRPKL